MTGAPITVTMREYEPVPLPNLPLDDARRLRETYGTKVSVQRDWYDSSAWQLTSQGYVGYIPLSENLHLDLQPKVPLARLFAMLEYAYDVGQFDKGEVEVESLQELYERLAVVLAKRILVRHRAGLYKDYVQRDERLAAVRGRLDMAQIMHTPWRAHLPCQFEEHTADVEENQILVWTLATISRSVFCRKHSRPTVRQAFRQMRNVATAEPMSASCCVDRLYNRLNEDYSSLHALCRFFLENSGTTHHRGDHTMVPFLINMAQLFETFVAAWLAQNAPDGFRFRAHRKVDWDETNGLHSDIDLVMENGQTAETLCVLDTKYKRGKRLSVHDAHQIVFYAELMGCKEAVLIYPTSEHIPLDAMVGDIHVRTLGLDLNDDLDTAGKRMLNEILATPRLA